MTRLELLKKNIEDQKLQVDEHLIFLVNMVSMVTCTDDELLKLYIKLATKVQYVHWYIKGILQYMILWDLGRLDDMDLPKPKKVKYIDLWMIADNYKMVYNRYLSSAFHRTLERRNSVWYNDGKLYAKIPNKDSLTLLESKDGIHHFYNDIFKIEDGKVKVYNAQKDLVTKTETLTKTVHINGRVFAIIKIYVKGA